MNYVKSYECGLQCTRIQMRREGGEEGRRGEGGWDTALY